MKCLCGCGTEVNEGRRYVSGPHAIMGKIPWNKKYPDKWKCEICGIMFPHDGRKMRFCSPKCWGKSKIGHVPWNKGLKGKQLWHNTNGLVKVKKGNTQGFQKGVIPKTAWKKGHKPWNYIDGRSKLRSPDRYGDDWNKIRILIYRRDGYICKDCGLTMSESQKKFNCPLHIHHIIPFLISFDNSLNNLISLCKSCHTKADAKIMWDSRKKKMAEELKQGK